VQLEDVMTLGKRVLGDPERLAQLLGICEALPEIEVSGGQHIAFRVRKKTFAYYLDDHHGDGIVALCCKSTLDRQANLMERHPGRYYAPDYVGPKGWVALRLDLRDVDWEEVAELIFAAYRLQAPRQLADQVG
jgi:phosphoribosylglycinamide formyltransferase-1